MSDRSQRLILDVLGYAAAILIGGLTLFFFRKPIDYVWTVLIGRI